MNGRWPGTKIFCRTVPSDGVITGNDDLRVHHLIRGDDHPGFRIFEHPTVERAFARSDDARHRAVARYIARGSHHVEQAIDTDDEGGSSVRASGNACQAGLVCINPATANTEALELPTCQPIVLLGEECSSPEACGDDAFCDVVDGNEVANADGDPSPRICQALKANGEACNTFAEECISENCVDNGDGTAICAEADATPGDICMPSF